MTSLIPGLRASLCLLARQTGKVFSRRSILRPLFPPVLDLRTNLKGLLVLKKFLLMVLVGLISPLALAGSKNICYEIFRLPSTSINDFAEIDFKHYEDPPTGGSPGGVLSSKRGSVYLTGLERDTQNWTVLGILEYKIDGTNLTVTRLIERPNLYGNELYNHMIDSILQKNLQLNSVTISLTGEFFQMYKKALIATGTPAEAIKTNPVYLQFQSLGFSEITALFELANTQQIFLRLTFTRPFQ
jgi:hypothetical protein